MTRGLLYSAYGEGSVYEASVSAKQAKSVMPDIHITAYAQMYEEVTSVDDVIPISQMELHGRVLPGYPDQGMFWKVKNAGRGPYNYTIFLDTDTYIIRPIWEIFELLESGKYHLAAVPDIARFAHGVPEGFPSLNTGFIAYDDSEETKEFFALWWEYEQAQTDPWADQLTFQKALYDSGLKFISLPGEYNLRFIFPVQLWGPVSMLHGRPIESFEGVATMVNACTTEPQLWIPSSKNGPGRIACRYNLGDIWTP